MDFWLSAGNISRYTVAENHRELFFSKSRRGLFEDAEKTAAFALFRLLG